MMKWLLLLALLTYAHGKEFDDYVGLTINKDKAIITFGTF